MTRVTSFTSTALVGGVGMAEQPPVATGGDFDMPNRTRRRSRPVGASISPTVESSRRTSRCRDAASSAMIVFWCS